MVTSLHQGWQHLLDDASLNFQLNRWYAYGGEAWLREVRPTLPRLTSYDAWRDEFCRLGDIAEKEGRGFHAALHFPAAEFFMLTSDPRKGPTRARLLAHFRAFFAGKYASCAVTSEGATLPVVRFGEPRERGALVIFGGFDSYIEEFFPMFEKLSARGYDVVGFEGPGQGAVLEDQHVPMTPDWHKPVGAVLDALGLDDVTLIGISLGGCLVMRAARFEARVRRVIAFDILTDFRECMLQQTPELGRPALRALLALRAGSVVDRLVNVAASRQPVIEWGIRQAMHVFGCTRPYEAWQAAAAFRTDDVSSGITQDVLLLAGAEDHYVPLEQLWSQARTLTRARSVSVRVFTREEDGQAHCQAGNPGLALDVMTRWIDGMSTDSVERAESKAEPV